MKNLWTFGCSFTAEYNPIDDIDNPSNYDKYKKWRGGNLPDIWPTILSKKLNMNIKNKGLGGESNYAIFNQFIEICEQIDEGDILIFGWTNLSRFQVVNVLEKIFIQILPCDNDFQTLTGLSEESINEIFINRTDTVWSREILQWIKFINLYCDKIGAKVFHWTSDEKIFSRETKVKNSDRFIVVNDEEFIKTQGHGLLGYLLWPKHNDGKNFATISDETNGEVMDGHFGELGHKLQAEYFYDFIRKYLEYN